MLQDYNAGQIDIIVIYNLLKMNEIFRELMERGIALGDIISINFNA